MAASTSRCSTLLAGAEVAEVIAWGTPAEALAGDTDEGLIINGRFRLSNGIDCAVFGMGTPYRGVDVWSEDTLIRWDWGPPEIYQGYDAHGARQRIEAHYAPYRWSEFGYLTTSIRSFLAAGGDGQRAGHLGPRPAASVGGGYRCESLGAAGGASRSSCRWKIAR